MDNRVFLHSRSHNNYEIYRHILDTITIGNVMAQGQNHNYKPDVGYVPDEQTAIKIAVAVWEPIYGVEKIAKEKPFHARLRNGVWYVNGSLPKGWLGGVAEAEIAKEDGRVLRISHGK